ncbi:MAG: translation initiation factor IF-2, partial [Candidatus Thermoplasmatota archaeon]|nr:translation initiation factor IF-2 [Candidatus Thermoplasmatota archaeon]
GLSQRFLESKIAAKSSDGLGTVMEVRRETSVGTILDAVLYQGKLKVGDQIAVNTLEGPALTKVKSMQVNKGRKASSLVERERVSAAIGVRVVISDKLDVLSGSPLIVVKKDPKKAFDEIRKESRVNINLSQNGILVKADALGSLEAICYELNQNGIPVRQTGIGNIARRDVMDVSTIQKAEERVIIGFNVDILPEAKEAGMTADIGIITGNVIYSIVQQTQEWIRRKHHEYEEMKKSSYPVPARIAIMEDHVFRIAKPVIAGVKVLSGRIKVGDTLIKSDGRYGGTIKSIRDNEMSVKFAEGGSEVSVAIDGVTMNRQIHPGETLYVDMTEDAVKQIRDLNLDAESIKTLEEIIKIKRKENIFWGTKA